MPVSLTPFPELGMKPVQLRLACIDPTTVRVRNIMLNGGYHRCHRKVGRGRCTEAVDLGQDPQAYSAYIRKGWVLCRNHLAEYLSLKERGIPFEVVVS